MKRILSRLTLLGAFISVLATGSCQGEKQEYHFGFDPADVEGASALLAVVQVTGPGSESRVLYHSNFEHLSDIGTVATIPMGPNEYIVILTYAEDYAGHTPVFVEPGEDALGLVHAESQGIFYAPVSSGETIEKLDPRDPDAAVFEAFAAKIFVDAAPSPTATPTATSTATPTAAPTATPTVTPTPTPTPVTGCCDADGIWHDCGASWWSDGHMAICEECVEETGCM